MSNRLRFDELNVLTSQIRSIGEGKRKGISPEQMCDDFLDALIMSYVIGVSDAAKVVGEDYTVPADMVQEAVYKKIGGETFEDRVRKYLAADDIESLIKVAETEAHRDYNQGVYDLGKVSGKPLKKKWITQMDDKVRDTHDYLLDTVVSLDDDFYTWTGAHAPFPGAFGDPAEDCNCRCYIELVPA